MKMTRSTVIYALMFLLISATAWAASPVDGTNDTPAIMAALHQKDMVPLDDTTIADIRGQAQYQMVKILGLNTWDVSNNVNVTFTWNPLDWRYGNWGGAGYTAAGAPVDMMDALFEVHDTGGTDEALYAGLQSLPLTSSSAYRWWGAIYQPTTYDLAGTSPDEPHFDYQVYVSRLSVFSAGGKFFWGRVPMPLTEYARRQALIGAAVLSVVP